MPNENPSDSLISAEMIEDFLAALSRRAEPGEGVEELRSLLESAIKLGRRRALLLGREFYPTDVEFSLDLLCRWPWKPPRSLQYLEAVRRIRLDIGTAPDANKLHNAVPDETLMLSFEQLFAMQREERVQDLFRMNYAKPSGELESHPSGDRKRVLIARPEVKSHPVALEGRQLETNEMLAMFETMNLIELADFVKAFEEKFEVQDELSGRRPSG